VLERHHLAETGIDLELRRRIDEERRQHQERDKRHRRSIGCAGFSTKWEIGLVEVIDRSLRSWRPR
jgi:hypothetical protein